MTARTWFDLNIYFYFHRVVTAQFHALRFHTHTPDIDGHARRDADVML